MTTGSVQLGACRVSPQTAREALIPSYMRSPDWRWLYATRCLLTDGLNLDTVMRDARAADDPWLYQVCEFYRNREERLLNDPLRMTSNPAMFEASMWHQSDTVPAGYRWLIEALLLTEASHEKIAEVMRPTYGVQTVTTYEKVFFDISTYKESKLHMLCGVLAYSEQSIADVFADCQYTWKLLAYDQGFDVFMDFLAFRAGGKLPEALSQYMYDVAASRRKYAEYHLTVSMRNMFKEEAQMALDYFNRSHQLQNNMPKAASAGAGGDAAKIVETSARAFLAMVEREKQLIETAPRRCLPLMFEPGLSDKFVPDQSLEQRLLPVVNTQKSGE